MFYDTAKNDHGLPRDPFKAGRSCHAERIPDFARNQACVDSVNLSALLHPGYD
jgi:hypothetical protein